MIDTLIIEDEKTAALRMERLLEEISDDIRVLENLQSIESSVKWLMANPHPDLIILDIQLADGLSFEIFKQLKIESFVIFTTAFDEYAIRAFELNSIDYLLKPVSKEKLSVSLEKFRKVNPQKKSFQIESVLDAIESQQKKYKKRFLISIGQHIRSLETNSIAYFYSKDKSTFLCSYSNRHYAIDYSLDKLETLLDPDQFFRINRQFLSSREALDKIFILSRSRIKISIKPEFDETVYVSNSRAHAFRKWLDE